MNILYVLPYIPLPVTFGGALRVYHLLKLAAQWNDISIVTYGLPHNEGDLRAHLGTGLKNVTIVPFTHWPVRQRRLAQFYSLFSKRSFFSMLAQSTVLKNALDRVLQENEFDVVQTEFAHMGLYELKTTAVKILDEHNVEYDNYRRMWLNVRSPLRRLYYWSEYNKFYREEIHACSNHDAILVTSERDKQILDADIPNITKHIIPNGVDATYFTPGTEKPEPFSLVFTGTMSYVPNSDGMLHFLENIFPLIRKQIPQVKIYIVGSRPTKALLSYASSNVIITGFVEDVRPFIRRSSIYVVPLRMGSGTRLKVLEAMAMKIPIVTTSIGAEGINVHDGESALIADEPEHFANTVVRLSQDQNLQQKLTKTGHELMRAHYEWSVIGRQLQKMYQSTLLRR